MFINGLAATLRFDMDRLNRRIALLHDSMREAGRDPDALAQSIIGLYKTEPIRREGPWRGAEAGEFATLDAVAWLALMRASILNEAGSTSRTRFRPSARTGCVLPPGERHTPLRRGRSRHSASPYQ
jgi:hypothetical protein